jgi:hypothetical protein
MKELGNTLAQLALIIMFMITLAVSTAALSQWASPDAAGADGGQTGQDTTATTRALQASATP